MVSRVITCSIKPEKVDEFRNAINDDFLPRIQAQAGFLENIESCDPASGEYCCMTLWRSASDVRNYDDGLFQEIAARLVPMMEGSPVVRTLPVENSSAHNIRAGAPAAA
jgi:quinol monooxygenase YgiN